MHRACISLAPNDAQQLGRRRNCGGVAGGTVGALVLRHAWLSAVDALALRRMYWLYD